MENTERKAAYDQQDNRANYTPAQNRRLRHKGNSPKTHSHDGLMLVDADGKVRRQVCARCNPPARRPRAVGGVVV